MTLPPEFQDWFARQGWAPHPHQLALLEAQGDTLLIAPTGGGKTLAGFLPSLVELAGGHTGLHTLYVSPLKALTADIARNLARPVAELNLPVRVEDRTGDTRSSQRARQRVDPPQILLTTPESLAIVRRVFQASNLALVEALQQSGARATSITGGVFEAEYLDQATYGLVGEVRGVNLAPIEASLRAGSIPVITSMGETASGQILNVNADFAANELVQELQPYKIIFLTGTGGLLDEAGNVIDSINLSTEYDHLIAQPWIHGGMKVKIEQIKDLLDRLPLESSVSITRPADLAKELFTHKGSGTLVRKGEKVLRATAWSELDLPRLKGLIESSFGRTLVPDYFEKTRLLRAYVSENYRTAVILTDEAEGVYLDKFAVLDDAQGEGLGRAVWNVMRDETPQLFWRSRHHNQVNIFYYAESDGCIKQEKWKVFWYGLDGFEQIQRCVAHCATRVPTLVG